MCLKTTDVNSIEICVKPMTRKAWKMSRKRQDEGDQKNFTYRLKDIRTVKMPEAKAKRPVSKTGLPS
jgi:hypothetical protein